jgi:hypothetical protein
MHPLIQAAHDFGNELFAFLKFATIPAIVGGIIWTCTEKKDGKQ